MLVSQGSVVRSDKTVMTAVVRQGLLPSPNARRASAMTQTVRMDCTATAGQKLNLSLAVRKSPNVVERLGTR